MVILMLLKLKILDTVKHYLNKNPIIAAKKYFCVTYFDVRRRYLATISIRLLVDFSRC